MKKILVTFLIILSTTLFGNTNVEMPNFSGKDQYQIEHILENYKGKVVFLNFWATWCPPCIDEIPDIQSLYEEYGSNKKDVIFLGISNENEEKVKKFLENGNYTFPTIIDKNDKIGREYFLRAFPTTYVIDKNGKYFGHQVGALSKDDMKKAIESALKK